MKTTTALHILQTISDIIAKNDDIESLLPEIVYILANNLNSDVCSVYIYDEDNDKLVLSATYGLNKRLIGKISLRPGEGITGTAFAKNEIINLASAKDDARYHHFKNLGEGKYNSFLSVPLVIGAKRVGVINLQKKIKEKFAPEVVAIVKSVSTHIANLILSSRMLAILSNVDADNLTDSGRIQEQIILRGVNVNPGIAMGLAVVYTPGNDFDDIESEKVDCVDKEIKVFETAVRKAKEETLVLEQWATSMISEADASIFYVHLLFLDDRTLLNAVRDVIKEGYTAQYAVKKVYNIYKTRFKNFKNEIFKEKVADLKDMMLRLANTIIVLKREVGKNEESLGEFISASSLIEGKNIKRKTRRKGVKHRGGVKIPAIIVAKELLPSDIFRLTSGEVAGIITEKGGVTSHIAILAKALNIPALLGVKNLLSHVRQGCKIIVDCNSSCCYINPHEDVIKHYREIVASQVVPHEGTKSSDTKTQDGCEIILRANISLISEIPLLKQYGAKGIGLYRTEFLYMIRDYLPNEEILFNVFSTIVKSADNEEVAFRLLDIGADKPLSYLTFQEESNPALGERGIRLLLKRQNILRPHLRAILRAGVFGNIKIICPMISCVSEIIELKKVIEEVKNELDKETVPYSKDFKFGIMLEVPSAFLQLELIIRHVDFISIGTNDLFQYTFASDRENSNISDIPQYLRPVFLSMIAGAADIVNNYPNKGVSVCGEMAGDPYAAPLLIGAGIYDLSMHPTKIIHMREMISRFTKWQCKKLLDRALLCYSAEDVYNLVRETLQIHHKSGTLSNSENKDKNESKNNLSLSYSME